MSDPNDHLLYAVLAVQLGFASPAQVVAAAAGYFSDSSRGLAERLLAEGVISEERFRLLQGLVGEAVKAHGGDVNQTMRSLGGEAVLQQSFAGSLVLEADGQAHLVNQSPADTVSEPEFPADEITPECPGRYTLSDEQGRGGQARVLLAVDSHIGREIAWKEMLDSRYGTVDDASSGISRAGSAVSRFLREARITGQLEHPNIVPVHELGHRSDGKPYYTMRLVRGQTLSQALAACFGLADRLRLLEHFVDICQAIAYAHSRGVIHRDIKPDNVMVGQFGETVLLDWGLAKVRGSEDLRHEDLERQVHLLHHWSTGETVDGSAMGTPSYMSPEQADGTVEEIDELSDVWGLGAVLFEILTGSPPYQGETPFEIVGKVLREPVPQVSSLSKDAPVELAAVAQKALAKVKAERYQSARELASDVSNYLTGGRVGAFAYSSWALFKRFAARNKPAMVAASLVMIVVLVSLVVVSVAYRSLSEAHEREGLAHQKQLENLRMARYRMAQAYVEKAERLIADGRFVAGRMFAAASLLNNPARPQSDMFDEAFVKDHPGTQALIVSAGSRIYQSEGSLRASLQRVFENPETAMRLAFSHDHRLLGAALHDGEIKIWDVESGKTVKSFKGHPKGAHALAFTPAGGLVTVGREGGVKLWDLAGPTEQLSLAGHKGDVFCLALSPDGKILATGGSDKIVILWSLPEGALLGTLEGHKGTVWTMSISTDGKTLATGSWDKSIRLWDIPSGQPGLVLPEQPDAVYGLAFSPTDENLLLAGIYDGSMRLLNPSTGELVRDLVGNGDAVYDVSFSADGQLVGSAGFDRTFRIWSTANGVLLYTLSGHLDALGALRFSGDGKHLATAGLDRKVRLWNLDTSRRLTSLEGHTDWVYDLGFSFDGRTLVSAGWDRKVRLWDLASSKNTHVLSGHKAGVFSAALSRDGRRIASADVDGRVLTWDAHTGAKLLDWQAHPVWIYHLRFSPDGQKLITSSRDRTAAIWDAVKGERMLVLQGHTDYLHKAVFSPDGKRVATASRDRTVRIWDALSGNVLRVLSGHEDWVSGVAFSPDGQQLASCGKDGVVVLWNATTGDQIRRLERHKQWVNSIRFSPDGQTLASASDDSTVVLWDVKSGQALLEISSSNSISTLAFSPDGQTLAVGDRFSVKLYPLSLSLDSIDPGQVLEQAQRESGLKLVGFELHPALPQE